MYSSKLLRKTKLTKFQKNPTKPKQNELFQKIKTLDGWTDDRKNSDLNFFPYLIFSQLINVSYEKLKILKIHGIFNRGRQ